MDEHTRASRARFLGAVGAAGVAGAAIAGGTWRTSKAGAASVPIRAYSAAHFALELDGSKEIGLLRSAEGGDAVGEVVNEVGSASYYQKKHIGNVKYEEILAEFGLGQPKDLYDWISASLTGKHERRSGSIIAADFNYEARARREFSNALITEVGFPAMDASSKDPAYMTVKLAPEQTEDTPASGKLSSGSKQQQKLWLPSNFRLEIKGLPTSRVNKIEALTIKQTAVTDDIGDARDYQKEPGKIEYPNLVFTLPEVDAQPWHDWFEDFVLEGNSGEEFERTGRLTYLAPNLSDELGRLEFFNLGIFKLSTAKAESSSDTTRRIKAELYCERIEFKYLAGTVG